MAEHAPHTPLFPFAPDQTEPPAVPCSACPFLDELLHLRQQAPYWKNLFQRCKLREQQLRQQLAEQQHWRRLYEQTLASEQALRQQLATLTAQNLILEKTLRGRKSEKKKRHAEATPGSLPTQKRRRGQQSDNPPPPRRHFDHLPTTDEPCLLPADQQACPHCGAPFTPFPGTDDGDLLEIDVAAHRRRYHRHRYAKSCTCTQTPALITAPPPPKLIPKGYLGISVWVLLLLEKYAAYQPTYRFLALLRSFGIDLPLGTVTDGLKKLVPLFEPLYLALAEHQRHEQHWHCDETRWLVFVEQQGKSGPCWSLWVFVSPQAVVFVLDPTRAHDVPEKHLEGASGIASVDRASVYKAMQQVKEGQIVLAFCWAHVRRDFLEVLTGYAHLSDWVISWLEEIRELYGLNDARLEALTAAAPALLANVPGSTPQADDALPADAATTMPLADAASTAVPLADAASTMPLAVADQEAPPAEAPQEQPAAVPCPQPPAGRSVADQRLRDQVAHVAQRRDRELQQPGLPPACTKILTSLQRHWSGLTLFLDHPEVPLDNNAAERAERGPVVARKNYYGSGALWSGRLAAMMFSLLQTLASWDLCPLRWLTAYLTACAAAGAKPPANAATFLPWNLSAEQKQQWAMPSSQRPAAAADTS
jgi:Transposase IS66 family